MTTTRRAIGVLVLSNLLGGIGVASGVAVGGLLAERLGGTAVAGLGQAMSVLGAAVAAVPLATVAHRHGRRRALAVGYALAMLGAAVVVLAAVVNALPVLLIGLALFGVASAANLQSRYAAADHAPASGRARAMSVVIWATTIGAVAGPNLTAPGNRVGADLGLPQLAGPYLFSVVAFAAGAIVLALALPRTASTITPGSAPRVGAWTALRWAWGQPRARFAVLVIACAHAVMVMVMVMTPVHMQHHGMSLELVGVVISLHVLGMYALSPLFGALADRWGAQRTAWSGIVILVVATALGVLAAGADDSVLTAVALTVLGIGWSASVIAGSALLTTVATGPVRIPLQGATDAGMNYAGALAAALAGPVLAWGGFVAVNLVALALLVPAALAGVAAARPGAPVASAAVGDR